MRPVHKNWAARKPWETAVPVARANRQRGKSVGASESLDDVPHRPRLACYPPGGPPGGPPVGPCDRLPDLYGSLSTPLGIILAGQTPDLLKAGLT